MKTVAIVYGTRPEAIKIAPIVNSLKHHKGIKIQLINTGQHADIIDPDLMEIIDDINLSVMVTNASLNTIFASVIQKLEPVLRESEPDLIVVQGDTTTAVAAAICGTNMKIPVAHVEAGLRTFDMGNPFPEEINRTLISRLATYHFCPTKQNKANLRIENISKNVWITGNTLMDAVAGIMAEAPKIKEVKKKFIAFTMHRRENLEQNRIFRYLYELLLFCKLDNIYHIALPMHPNPKVQDQVKNAIRQAKAGNHISLMEPMSYRNFIHMAMNCWMVCSDSGGIQEEITAIKRPLFILRSATERPETLMFPGVKICHTPHEFRNELIKFRAIFDEDKYQRSVAAIKESPFGDGKSGPRIASIIKGIVNGTIQYETT